MFDISENTKAIANSKIRRMFNKALEFDDPISFTIGEPDFTASQNIVEASYKALKEGKSKYSENIGILPLREAISKYLEKEISVSYDPKSEIVIVPGAMGGLYQSLKALLNPGDEVIINEPCWTNYIQQVEMCYAVPVSVSTKLDEGFCLDIEAIEAAITDKTKIIMINTPCNPTGAVLGREELEKLADIAKKYDLLIISDEVYKHIIFDDNEFVSIASIEGMKERTLVIDSCSKTFAMTGFRAGYVAGPAFIVKEIVKLQENISACVAMPSQYAALEAYTGAESMDHLKMMVDSYKARRDYVYERVSKMPLIKYEKSRGTFYAFISVKETGMTSEEFAMKLLEDKHVVLVPGDAFGGFGEGFIRISFAASMESLEKGLDALEDFLRKVAE